MNKWMLLIGFFLLVHATGVFATCTEPRLTIAAESLTIKTYEGDTFDVNLTFSGDSPLISSCICGHGQDCGFKWQYLNNGSWSTISSSSSTDLNCNGTTCSTGTGYPGEDQVYTKTIVCVDNDSYLMRGYIPQIDKATNEIRVYCYQELVCIPPVTGNFFLDKVCTYNNVPLFIDGNYHVLRNGHAIHNNSDVNFFSTEIHNIKIRDGGQIDLNESSIFVGISSSSGFAAGGLLILVMILFAGNLFAVRREVSA